MTLAWITLHKIKGFVFKECFKNHPYTCLRSSLFFTSWKHTEFLVIFFNHTENHLSTLVRETVVWSLWKKSILFYTHNNFRKNDSFNASRIEKIHWNVVKITFSYGNYHILTFFFMLLNRVADQGPSSTVIFSLITSKTLKSGTWNFMIIKRNIKAIFRGYFFSSLQFDSGKIFVIIIFSRGPRTTYKFWRIMYLLRNKTQIASEKYRVSV